MNWSLFHLGQVTKGRDSLAFYSLPEFQEWKDATENFHTWKVKYYKGESRGKQAYRNI